MKESPPASPVAEQGPPGLGLALALFISGGGIIAHAVLADWRPSPGGNPWLVPVIAGAILLFCALLLARRARHALADQLTTVGEGSPGSVSIAVATLITAGWGLGFFHAVQGLGLATASWLFMTVGMLALAPEPRRAWRVVLPLSAAIALAFWLLFTRLAPVVLADPLLW